ncbi:MAG: STAS domain-containing protein [Pseudonocardiaceae bacterium]
MTEAPHRSQSALQTVPIVTVSDITPDIVLCVVNGEIDLLTEPILREKLTEAIAGTPRHLVIDLCHVQFMGSTGLTLLMEFRATQRATGRQLAIVVGDNRVVTRPLQVTGLDYIVDLYTELAMAVRACRTPDNHDSIDPKN